VINICFNRELSYGYMAINNSSLRNDKNNPFIREILCSCNFKVIKQGICLRRLSSVFILENLHNCLLVLFMHNVLNMHYDQYEIMILVY